MKKNDRLICYYISEPKRLAKVARYLGKVAFRIQYSIFYLPSVSQEELEVIIQTIISLIEKDQDDVKIYKIVDNGYHFADAINLDEPFIILS